MMSVVWGANNRGLSISSLLVCSSNAVKTGKIYRALPAWQYVRESVAHVPNKARDIPTMSIIFMYLIWRHSVPPPPQPEQDVR